MSRNGLSTKVAPLFHMKSTRMTQKSQRMKAKVLYTAVGKMIKLGFRETLGEIADVLSVPTDTSTPL